ncbi:MAG TPA: CAP domain-containing protein [Dehalococcoidia bacterium]|nr:CAP domain-containing protein [Dehalococcoidia bacterium]
MSPFRLFTPPSNAAARRTLALLLALLTLSTAVRAGRVVGQAGQLGTAVSYDAGWNLVALPSGTALPSEVGPAFTLSPDGSAYEQLAAGGAIGGRAQWVYFPQSATLTLGASAAESSRRLATPGQSLLIGNPSSDATLAIGGAEQAYSFDPVHGWTAVTSLAPGRGALVQVDASGSVTLGQLSGDALDARVRRLQSDLATKPTDRATVESVAQVASELMRSRQYDRVQALLDDLRGAQEDGLRSAGSGLLPGLSTDEQRAVVSVREGVAKAETAATAGDLTAADAAIEQSLRAARAASDAAIQVARGDDAGPAAASVAFTWANAAQSAPAGGLAAAGALLRATFLLTGLGTPPSDQVWSLVDTLTNASACPVAPTALTPDAEERRMLDLTNALRAENGLPPLQFSAALQRTAAWKAHAMVTQLQYGHDDSFGSLTARFDACGYPTDSTFIGENLNGGKPSADAVFADWKSDSSHLVNLLGADFVAVGIKRAPAAASGGTYTWVWVMDLGSTLDAPLAGP